MPGGARFFSRANPRNRQLCFPAAPAVGGATAVQVGQGRVEVELDLIEQEIVRESLQGGGIPVEVR